LFFHVFSPFFVFQKKFRTYIVAFFCGSVNRIFAQLKKLTKNRQKQHKKVKKDKNYIQT